MIASQRVFVCSANSILAVVGASGFDITLGRSDLQTASARSAGECLSSLMDSQTEDVAVPSTGESLVDGGAKILERSKGAIKAGIKAIGKKLGSKFVSQLSSMQIKIPSHYFDAMITWAQGVVSGLQDMTQVIIEFTVGLLIGQLTVPNDRF